MSLDDVARHNGAAWDTETRHRNLFNKSWRLTDGKSAATPDQASWSLMLPPSRAGAANAQVPT